MRVFVALLLIWAGLTSSVMARTEFGVYGAHGDAGNTDECPANQFMMGVEARTGGWFDQIAVVCGQLTGYGALRRDKTMDRRGGTGGSPIQGVCDNEEAVVDLKSWRTKNYQIKHIEMTCQNIRTGATHSISVPPGDRSDAVSPLHKCKLPERATGLVIRYGKHVNGLALVCDTRLAPSRPSVPGPPDPPERFVEVLTNVDVLEAPRRGSKKIATLPAGTREVRLLGVEGGAFFHVQWPQGSGWVFDRPPGGSLRVVERPRRP